MPSELESNVRNAFEKLAKALSDASELIVETRYVVVESSAQEDLDQSRLVAKTVIQIDGDHHTTIPMRKLESEQLVVDEDLLEIHRESVASAIDYRMQALETLIDLVKTRFR
jgi:hypothetical protein